MEGERPDKERHYVSPSNALSCARQLSYRAAGTPGKPMEPSGWWVTSLGKFVHRVLEDALLDEFGPEGCTPEAMIGTKVPLLDDELELADYEANFRRMYGNPRMDAVLGSVDGSVRFHGLTPTSLQLEGLDRHQRLIDSYKKLHAARAKEAAA
jgi:hypothetical protein